MRPKITLEELFKELHRDHPSRPTLSISPSPLWGDEGVAVAVTFPSHSVWLKPYKWGGLPGVFMEIWQEDGSRELRFVGELMVDTPPVSVDDLYEFVERLMTTCPRCHGSGEVEVIDVLESGHAHRDTAPCPVCTQFELPLPF